MDRWPGIQEAGRCLRTSVWSGHWVTCIVSRESMQEGAAESKCAIFFPLVRFSATATSGGYTAGWCGLCQLQGNTVPASPHSIHHIHYRSWKRVEEGEFSRAAHPWVWSRRVRDGALLARAPWVEDIGATQGRQGSPSQRVSNTVSISQRQRPTARRAGVGSHDTRGAVITVCGKSRGRRWSPGAAAPQKDTRVVWTFLLGPPSPP